MLDLGTRVVMVYRVSHMLAYKYIPGTSQQNMSTARGFTVRATNNIDI